MRCALPALFGLLFVAPAQAMVGNAPLVPFGDPRSEVAIVGQGSFCTGTAIAPDLVITAAHCVSESRYAVMEADTGGRVDTLVEVAQIARHPKFDMHTFMAHRATADVAILKMAKPLNLMPALTLAKLDRSSVIPQPAALLRVVGYGVTRPGDGSTGGKRRSAQLAVTGKPGNLQIRLFDPATQNKAAGLGACTGDSGGPVYNGDVLIGVVSWSTGPENAAGCGGLTGVTPIALYRQWIEDTARRFGATLQ